MEGEGQGELVSGHPHTPRRKGAGAWGREENPGLILLPAVALFCKENGFFKTCRKQFVP